jgi:hypothetical protein
MKPSSVPRKRLYILDGKNRPVEVFDFSEWSHWMSENDDLSAHLYGGTRRDNHDPLPRCVRNEYWRCLLFVTRVAGMQERDNESYGARALDEALEQHERP